MTQFHRCQFHGSGAFTQVEMDAGIVLIPGRDEFTLEALPLRSQVDSLVPAQPCPWLVAFGDAGERLPRFVGTRPKANGIAMSRSEHEPHQVELDIEAAARRRLLDGHSNGVWSIGRKDQTRDAAVRAA